MLAGSIYRTSRELPGLSDRARAEIEMAVADTLAVMAAGWNEPAARGPRNAYPAIRLPWETDNGGDPDPEVVPLNDLLVGDRQKPWQGSHPRRVPTGIERPRSQSDAGIRLFPAGWISRIRTAPAPAATTRSGPA